MFIFFDFSFQKIFPTSQSYNYHKFFEAPRYYNMLFDSWEIKQSKDRTKGKNNIFDSTRTFPKLFIYIKYFNIVATYEHWAFVGYNYQQAETQTV